MATRDLDIVVFGATGDTGVVACCCLYFRGKRLGLTRWAPAARNLGKLKTDVLDRFRDQEPGKDGLAPMEAIQADSGDYESLVKMCRRTKCVVACAGPYAQFGEGVVRACVEAGTNYVDVTGEMPWVEKMQRKYGAEAEKKGVTVISCAGYDSVPPDVTTFLAAKACEKVGDRLRRFEAIVGSSGGALPTGTLNTVLSNIDYNKRKVLNAVSFGMLGAPAKKAVQNMPASTVQEDKESTFVPKAEQGKKQSNLIWTMLPSYSALAGQFCLPHFMAPINICTVHHTAAKEGYGGIEYREWLGGLPRGALSLFGLLPALAGVMICALTGPLMVLPGFSTVAVALRDKFNTPLKDSVRNRAFKNFASTGKTYVHGYGISQGGRKVQVKMHSEYDGGLSFTMLSACSIAAAVTKREGSSNTAKRGINSAAVALGGEALADALRASGMTLDVSI